MIPLCFTAGPKVAELRCAEFKTNKAEKEVVGQLVERTGVLGLWVTSESGLQKKSINAAIEYTMLIYSCSLKR